jgi:hypothetical protein
MDNIWNVIISETSLAYAISMLLLISVLITKNTYIFKSLNLMISLFSLEIYTQENMEICILYAKDDKESLKELSYRKDLKSLKESLLHIMYNNKKKPHIGKLLYMMKEIEKNL